MVILGYRAGEPVKKTIKETNEDNVLGISAQVAFFYLMYWLLPFVSTIGAVMVLLSWMYFVSVVILVGGELNSELHKGTGSVASRKGSVYAGRIATREQPADPSGKIE
ncbi:MAG: hypothetical protein M3Z54_03540 [Gemmatimonadota bacterium]|nr:hypothetical protein [Gemmatimonadota bacterium]